MPRRTPSNDSSEAEWRDSRSYSQTNRYPELATTGRLQEWVLDRSQLASAGWTRHRIDHEIRVGRWTAAAPGVVALQNGPLDRNQMKWLGVLHAGRSSALTRLTACEEAGLQWTADPTIHVLTQKGDLVSPLKGFRFHQSRRPFHRWVSRPPAHPARIDLEHAALLTAERDQNLRRAIGLLAAAVQQRLTTAERLLVASSSIRKLRNGQPMRLALGDIAGGAQSFAEIDAVRLCIEAGLKPPARQVRRKDKQGLWRYLDLEWVLDDGRVLVLEVDGSFHMRTENWWRDKKRERGIVISGRTVLRCASIELRLEPAGVIEDLAAAGVPRLGPRFVWRESA